MRDPIRRAAAVLSAALVVVIAACDTGTPAVPTPPPTGSLTTPVAGSPSASASAPGSASSAPSATPTPELTPVPGGQSPAPEPDSTTQTDWGVIRDSLPVGFPVYPGASEADPLEPPASAAFSIGADGQTIATWYQAALETAGFSTLQMSQPLEDGQIIIDSVGEPTTCRVQTTIRPLSGTTHVSILYGADCPA